jgi:hypothetical protein
MRVSTEVFTETATSHFRVKTKTNDLFYCPANRVYGVSITKQVKNVTDFLQTYNKLNWIYDKIGMYPSLLIHKCDLENMNENPSSSNIKP